MGAKGISEVKILRCNPLGKEEPMKNSERQHSVMRFVYLENSLGSCTGMDCSKDSNFHMLCT